MTLFLLTLLAAVAIGSVTGGRLRHLAAVRLDALWVVKMRYRLLTMLVTLSALWMVAAAPLRRV